MSEWVVPMVWTHQGHVVVEAETAAEARAQALAQPFDLAAELVDWDVGTPRRRA